MVHWFCGVSELAAFIPASSNPKDHQYQSEDLDLSLGMRRTRNADQRWLSTLAKIWDICIDEFELGPN